MEQEVKTYKGYMVYMGWREFVRTTDRKGCRTIEFIPFDSPKGQKLLEEMRAENIQP